MQNYKATVSPSRKYKLSPNLIIRSILPQIHLPQFKTILHIKRNFLYAPQLPFKLYKLTILIRWMDSQSEQEYPSISQRLQSRALQSVERSECSFNYMQLIRNALKDYEDVDESEFVMMEEVNENPFHQLANTYMHNTHRTLVPIGANFQVVVPPMLSESAYKVKSHEMMKTLRVLKLNDPQEGEEFYEKYFGMIEERFGPGRSYDDVNHLRNALKRMNSHLTFEEYLNKNYKYWENHFKNKDRNTMPKPLVKKKKKKGTIPT